MERVATWKEAHGSVTEAEEQEAREGIEREVLDEVKALHATSPKYVFAEKSQAEVIEAFNVEVVRLDVPTSLTHQRRVPHFSMTVNSAMWKSSQPATSANWALKPSL